MKSPANRATSVARRRGGAGLGVDAGDVRLEGLVGDLAATGQAALGGVIGGRSGPGLPAPGIQARPARVTSGAPLPAAVTAGWYARGPRYPYYFVKPWSWRTQQPDSCASIHASCVRPPMGSLAPGILLPEEQVPPRLQPRPAQRPGRNKDTDMPRKTAARNMLHGEVLVNDAGCGVETTGGGPRIAEWDRTFAVKRAGRRAPVRRGAARDAGPEIGRVINIAAVDLRCTPSKADQAEARKGLADCARPGGRAASMSAARNRQGGTTRSLTYD